MSVCRIFFSTFNIHEKIKFSPFFLDKSNNFLRCYKNWSSFLDKVPGPTKELKITTIPAPMEN